MKNELFMACLCIVKRSVYKSILEEEWVVGLSMLKNFMYDVSRETNNKIALSL